MVTNRNHEVRNHGGGLDRVRTTGPKPTPAHPKVAPPSRHNTGKAVAGRKDKLCAGFGLRGSTSSGHGIYRSEGRLVEEGGAVNSRKYAVIFPLLGMSSVPLPQNKRLDAHQVEN